MKLNHGWPQEKLDYLISHYGSERASDIAAVINKTINSVHHKAHMLGLHKDKEKFFSIRSKACSGANSGNFKNYRRKTSRGYIECYNPNHPNATTDGLVMEHRLVAEQKLGCILPKEFDVHHINGIKSDNRIENLAIMTHGAHTAFHNKKG